MPTAGAEIATSERAYEDHISDRFDWGERRNLLAYRWCRLVKRFVAQPVDCGPVPAGIEERGE